MKTTLIINTKSKRDRNGNSLLTCDVISSENNHGYTCNYSNDVMDTNYDIFGMYIIRRNTKKGVFTIQNENLKEFKEALENHYGMIVLSHESNL